MAKYDARNIVNKAAEWSTLTFLFKGYLMLIFLLDILAVMGLIRRNSN